MNFPIESNAQTPGGNRRRFLQRTLTASGFAALARLFPGLAEAQSFCGVQPTNAPLQNPPFITYDAQGLLKATLRVQGQQRNVNFYNAPNYDCRVLDLRAYLTDDSTPPIKPSGAKPGQTLPGPTFRARVGGMVQIAFLNHLDFQKFPRTVNNACDTSTIAGTEKYPGKDRPINCFRASNTSNMHLHGFHVSPEAFGDNVLVSVVPDPHATAAQCKPIFDKCMGLTSAKAWMKMKVFQDFKKTAYRRLAALEQLMREPGFIHTNEQDDEGGEWAQYWPGYYPICFQLPDFDHPPEGKKYVMGQAPGTHWYHAHQHGSTSEQLLNGLAGAFIIEGAYDQELKTTMPNVQENVVVIQQISDKPNLVRTSGGKIATLVNGQLQPSIAMSAGEVQWWRIVNAGIQAGKLFQYFFAEKSVAQKISSTKPVPPDRGIVPEFRQIAQDGVQFHWDNYQSHWDRKEFHLAPGNRVDLLVKAPAKEKGAPPIEILLVSVAPGGAIGDINSSTILNVRVGDEDPGKNMKWPTIPPPKMPTDSKSDYPAMPGFLKDITDEEVKDHCRTVTFSMDGATGSQPKFMIDGKQFSEGTIDQLMLLNTAEEWTLVNTSTVMHPFHIHVNPFQIVEVLDPAISPQPIARKPPYVWSDVVPLPPKGHVKIRHRFVDFPGKFVLHCHILGHEDRGMMQLVQVLDNKTAVAHH